MRAFLIAASSGVGVLGLALIAFAVWSAWGVRLTSTESASAELNFLFLSIASYLLAGVILVAIGLFGLIWITKSKT
jgi:hypothetical protein